ncbi:hypothetical protein H1C71_001745, partial [Ictidomys tridecemlineatus]
VAKPVGSRWKGGGSHAGHPSALSALLKDPSSPPSGACEFSPPFHRRATAQPSLIQRTGGSSAELPPPGKRAERRGPGRRLRLVGTAKRLSDRAQEERVRTGPGVVRAQEEGGPASHCFLRVSVPFGKELRRGVGLPVPKVSGQIIWALLQDA